MASAEAQSDAIWRGMQPDNELLAMNIADIQVSSSVLGALLKKINPACGG